MDTGTPAWNQVVDEIAFTSARGEFLRAVDDNAHMGDGFRAFLRRHEKGFAIMRGDVRLATINPTRTRIPHRKDLCANFLVAGPHWQQVADVIRDAEPELVAEWERDKEAKAVAAAAKAERRGAARRRRIDRLPGYLGTELIDACLDASRRIRLERQVAYERPVVLECPIGELTLMPIGGPETGLLVPFRLASGTETVEGELALIDHDPLPLLIGAGVADEDAIIAWICALLGFADVTCIETEPAELAFRHIPARPQWHPSTSAYDRRPVTQTLPHKRLWLRNLEPVGHWIQHSGSLVAGHRRHLNDGQTASAEARDRARRVGIILHPTETWVRPHTRGVPDDVEMRFRWHAQPELKLAILDRQPRLPQPAVIDQLRRALANARGRRAR